MRGVVLLPVRKKSATIAERLSKLEQIVKKQDQIIKELQREIKRLDLDEVSELGEKLNKPNQLRGK